MTLQVQFYQGTSREEINADNLNVLPASDISVRVVKYCSFILPTRVAVELINSVWIGRNEPDSMTHDFRSKVSTRNSDLKDLWYW